MGNFIEQLPETIRTGIPAELINEPSLQTIPDVPTLIKSYVHAQKMVGVDKIPRPQDTWKPEQWESFYDALGRPKDSLEYAPSKETKFEEGVTFDEERMKAAKQTFHKLGLTKAQGQQMLDFYVGMVNDTFKKNAVEQQQTLRTAEESLRKEWGADYDKRLEVARAALKRAADPELLVFLETSGLGNNPALVKAFEKIGKTMLEDRSDAGRSMRQTLSGATAAKAEIDTLRLDKDFMQALNAREHPGHKAAVETWMNLHRQAFPGTVEDQG